MLDGYVYAIGGWEGTVRLDSIERYNPVSNTWTFVAPMKMAVTSPAVVSYDGMLYVTGEILYHKQKCLKMDILNLPLDRVINNTC